MTTKTTQRNFSGVPEYRWPVNEFINRKRELAALDNWWEDADRDALALIGRRRVGKSWLFRAFADQKPAIILVAGPRSLADQLDDFAQQLEAVVGVVPHLPDLGSLLKLIYRIGHDKKVLAVIDEFPFLLGEGKEKETHLSQIFVSMEEERDSSQTKLLLCGSSISQMEALLEQNNPLHGRIRKMNVWPMSFSDSKALCDTNDTATERITRYAIAGGMARYLSRLGYGDVKEAICQRALDPDGALFSDPANVLSRELRDPGIYFSLLSELSTNAAKLETLSNSVGENVYSYLDKLISLRLASRYLPVGEPQKSRKHKYQMNLQDGYTRFWFRFIFPHLESLQNGLDPEALWEAEIAPHLSEFVSPLFEELCQLYTRKVYGRQAPEVGNWWGNAQNKYRRKGSNNNVHRTIEEIDVAAIKHKNLVIAGECKWTNAVMDYKVLSDLRHYKLPAIAEAKRLKVPKDPKLLLFSRSGFDDKLQDEASTNANVKLIGTDELVKELLMQQSAF